MQMHIIKDMVFIESISQQTPLLRMLLKTCITCEEAMLCLTLCLAMFRPRALLKFWHLELIIAIKAVICAEKY